MREEDTSNWGPDLSSPPDGYLRKSDLEIFFKAIGVFVTVMGMVWAGVKYVDAVRDYVDRKVDNEHNERLNWQWRHESDCRNCKQ